MNVLPILWDGSDVWDVAPPKNLSFLLRACVQNKVTGIHKFYRREIFFIGTFYVSFSYELRARKSLNWFKLQGSAKPEVTSVFAFDRCERCNSSLQSKLYNILHFFSILLITSNLSKRSLQAFPFFGRYDIFRILRVKPAVKPHHFVINLAFWVPWCHDDYIYCKRSTSTNQNTESIQLRFKPQRNAALW